MWLVVTKRGLSFSGYGEGEEQMGCSLFKVGALAKMNRLASEWRKKNKNINWKAREWIIYSSGATKIGDQLTDALLS